MNHMTSYRNAGTVKVRLGRLLILLCAAFLIGIVIGVPSGYAVKSHITGNSEAKGQPMVNESDEKEILVYGAYDDRIFTEEISIDWSPGDMEFTPLDVELDEDIQEFTFYLCAGYNIDFSLVMALMEHESSYDADVVSRTNDYGLMQINQVNHEWLTETIGVTDYLDPYQNIRAGCFILRKLFEKYQSADMVLMAYNMGEAGASRLWEQGIFSTSYSESVLDIQRQLNEQLEEGR